MASQCSKARHGGLARAAVPLEAALRSEPLDGWGWTHKKGEKGEKEESEREREREREREGGREGDRERGREGDIERGREGDIERARESISITHKNLASRGYEDRRDQSYPNTC